MGDALPRRVEGGMIFPPNSTLGSDNTVRFRMALEAIALLDGANQGIAMKAIAKQALDPKVIA